MAGVTATSGTAPFIYLWSNGESTSAIANLTSGNYSVTVTDVNLCTATASFTINPSSVPSVIITADKVVMCMGDSAHICAPSGYASYLWNTGETAPCISTKLAGIYYVTITDNSNCTANSNHLSISSPFGNNPLSRNGDTLFTGAAAATYQWYLDNVPISGANSMTYLATQSGNYHVIFCDSSGCCGGAGDYFFVNCFAHFNIFPDTTTPHHWFALTQTHGTSPFTYLWHWGDGDSSTGPTASHIYNSPGNYNICLTVSDYINCVATYCDSSTYIYKTDENIISIQAVSQLPTGISQIRNPQSAFRISPNPATNTLTINIDETLIGATATIADITGRTVMAVELVTRHSSLVTSDFSSGVYFVTVSNGQSKATKKLVVSR